MQPIKLSVLICKLRMPIMCWWLLGSYLLLSLCGWSFACLLKASITFHFQYLPLPDFTRIFILQPNWILYQTGLFLVTYLVLGTKVKSDIEKTIIMIACMITFSILLLFIITISSMTPWLPVNPKLSLP
jgi:hypothetical protein